MSSSRNARVECATNPSRSWIRKRWCFYSEFLCTLTAHLANTNPTLELYGNACVRSYWSRVTITTRSRGLISKISIHIVVILTLFFLFYVSVVNASKRRRSCVRSSSWV